VWVMLCTDPTGGTMLFRWGYLALGTVAAVIAAIAVARPPTPRLPPPQAALPRESAQV